MHADADLQDFRVGVSHVAYKDDSTAGNRRIEPHVAFTVRKTAHGEVAEFASQLCGKSGAQLVLVVQRKDQRLQTSSPNTTISFCEARYSLA